MFIHNDMSVSTDVVLKKLLEKLSYRFHVTGMRDNKPAITGVTKQLKQLGSRMRHFGV